MSRPGNLSIKSGDGLQPDQQNKKARFICLERAETLQSQKARNSQSGLCALAEYLTCPQAE